MRALECQMVSAVFGDVVPYRRMVTVEGKDGFDGWSSESSLIMQFCKTIHNNNNFHSN